MIEETRPQLDADEGKKMLAEVQTHIEALGKVSDTYIRLASSGNPEDLKPMIPPMASFIDGMSKTTREFRDLQLRLLKEAKAQSEVLESHSMWVNTTLSGLLCAVGILVFFIVRGISKTLRQAAGELNDGADQVASAASQVSASSLHRRNFRLQRRDHVHDA